ncbi:hypothetical protein R3P38DRAFT_3167528 [Favolaschia claudopus]|uniref:Transposase n=1 Tax=Favolaschia claudopus TaxID=2862362 RepID=A0AAW0E3R5_9AGAR
MCDTSATKKSAIVALKEAGWSNRDVAEKENVAPSTVSRINARYGPTHDFDAKTPRQGRPRKINERDVPKALRLLSSGKAKNASDLQRKYFPHLHVDTIRARASKRRPIYQEESQTRRRECDGVGVYYPIWSRTTSPDRRNHRPLRLPWPKPSRGPSTSMIWIARLSIFSRRRFKASLQACFGVARA